MFKTMIQPIADINLGIYLKTDIDQTPKYLAGRKLLYRFPLEYDQYPPRLTAKKSYSTRAQQRHN